MIAPPQISEAVQKESQKQLELLAERIQQLASHSTRPDSSISSILENYSGAEIIPGVINFFDGMRESRRQMFVAFLFGIPNLCTYFCANLLWRTRDDPHHFSTLESLQQWISKMTECTSHSHILFSGTTLAKCREDLLNLARVVSCSRHQGSGHLAESIAISIPPVHIYETIEKWMNFSLKQSVAASIVSYSRARAIQLTICALWAKLWLHFSRFPLRKRAKCDGVTRETLSQ